MRRIAFLLSLALFTLAPRTLAQTGFPAFGSFEQGGFDAINRQNLNVIFAIPIMSTPARGQSFQYSLVNNSLLWTQTTIGTTTSWTPVVDANGNPTWGWNYGPAVTGSGQIIFQSSQHTCRYIDPNTGLYAFYPWTLYLGSNYKDWQGTVHPFGVSYVVASTDASTYCGIQSTTLPVSGYSSDNTGFLLTVARQGVYSVQAPSGVSAGGAPVDTNGNFVSQTVVNSTETDWTDTAGHLALKVFKNSTNIQHEWQDSSGNYTSATTTTVLLTSTNIKTNFGCSATEYTGSASLPTEIDLPNGQKYLITYEPTSGNSGYYTGRVKRVTLPTGGYYEYDYTGSNDSVNCSDGSTMLVTRVMNDGSSTSTWSFSRSGSVTTVTYPQMPYDSSSNNALYTFSGTEQTNAKFYQGAVLSANLKRTMNTTWATNGSPATQITVLEDGNTQNETETSYDNYGNLLSLKEHDWGTGTPGSTLRTTTLTYLATTPYITANILNRPTRITVADGSGTTHSRTDISYDDSGYINYGTCHTGVVQHSDTSGGCTVTVRGNVTTVTTYANAAAPSGSIVHHTYYDNLGNVVKADLDCCQSKTWSYSSTTNYSFPDSATRGSSPGTQLTTSATYNPYTGLVATSVDENSQSTAYTYDSLKRLTNLQRPDLTNLTWTYTDATPPTQSSVKAGIPIQSSNEQNTITTVDGLGRPVTQQITDGTTTYSIVGTQYDPLGRPYKSSNPYTSTAQYWTATQLDILGRLTLNIFPDNSQTTFSYTTNTATGTDPAGKARKSVADGLGRMTSVYEPDPANGNSLTLQTSYTYNILDLLTGVSQGSQTRTYSFDDLGRLNSVATPEAGTVCFGTYSGSTCQANGYNSFGELLYRADARGVLTSYSYDNLNRLSGISYNVGTSGVTATPSVTLNYDQGGSAVFALGRLTSMTDGVGSETYSYNNLGENTGLQKVIGSTTYPLSYAYNLAGELTSITYPSSRVVQQSYDNIGRLCAVGTSGSTCTTGITYETGISYNPAFQVTGLSYGNGVTATIGYTPDRLLLQSLAYTKGSTTLLSTNYWYKTDPTNCPAGASGNNGQIQCISDNVDSGRTAAYSYDALYRLTSATTNGSTNYPKWGLSMNYDRYGNRTGQSISSGCVSPMTCPTNSVTVSPTTNQITGSPYAYDANGNMTNDGQNTLVYDSENRLLSATNGSSSGSYTYDGNSLRVKKVAGSTTAVYIFSGSKVIAEYNNGAAPSTPSREYIFSGGTRIASISPASSAPTVQNPSFEVSPNVPNQSTDGPYGNPPISGWQASGTLGLWQPVNGDGCAYSTAPDGKTVAWTHGGTFSQDLGVGAQGGATYTLSVAVGHRFCFGSANYTITLNAGTTALCTTTASNSTIPANTFQTVTLTCPVPTSPPSGDLDIILSSPGTGEVDFDNVQLSASGSAITYYHTDHLSNRLVTDLNGNILEQLGHFPFGESWYNTSNDKLLFTTYERDSESGNDYAIMRSYVNRLGRFSSPDPLEGDTGDPQSFNRYVYVLNDPCNLGDPLGLKCKLRFGLLGQKLDASAQDRIRDIFNAAGVDVQFVPSGKADFYIWQSNVSLATDAGTLFGTAQTGFAIVDNNAILYKTASIVGSSVQGYIQGYSNIGMVISHELGHLIIPCGHGGPLDCGPRGLMRSGPELKDGAFLNMGLPGDLNFTQTQATAIQNRCKSLRAGTGGGAAGPHFHMYQESSPNGAADWGSLINSFGPGGDNYLAGSTEVVTSRIIPGPPPASPQQ